VHEKNEHAHMPDQPGKVCAVAGQSEQMMAGDTKNCDRTNQIEIR
jgi:hypothetical protein